MKKFRSLKALEYFLKNRIAQALQAEVPNVVADTMETHILREVYLKYPSPKIYERRGNDGGLLDRENITWNRVSSNTIEVMNITKRNINYTNQYLAPVIEYGHKEAEAKGYRGYSFPYPQYAYYYPRPFIKATREDLMKNKQHVKAFQNSLKSYGINSKHV